MVLVVFVVVDNGTYMAVDVILDGILINEGKNAYEVREISFSMIG